jgi:hypothetical protein
MLIRRIGQFAIMVVVILGLVKLVIGGVIEQQNQYEGAAEVETK